MTGLNFAQSLFKGLTSDADIIETEGQIAQKVSHNLLCPITMKPIKVPARGDLCKHLTCFELESYININTQHKRWKCPQCNRRALKLYIDSYSKVLLDLVKNLK